MRAEGKTCSAFLLYIGTNERVTVILSGPKLAGGLRRFGRFGVFTRLSGKCCCTIGKEYRSDLKRCLFNKDQKKFLCLSKHSLVKSLTNV